MNRNQFIGFLLIGLIFLGYFWLTAPSKEEIRKKQIQDSIANVQKQNKIVEKDTTKTIDTNQVSKIDSNAIFKTNSIQTKYITLKNDKIKLKISSKGAYVYSSEINEFKTFNKKNLVLFEGKDNSFNLRFYANNELINTKDLYFETEQKQEILDASQQEKKLSLKSKVADNKYLEYVYILKPNSYIVEFKVNFVNLDSIISIGTTFLEMDWQEKTNILERGDKWERQNVLLSYRISDGKVKSLKNTKDEYTENISFKIQWISFKQQFFNATLISHENFETAQLTTKQLKTDTTATHLMIAQATIPFRLTPQTTLNYTYYFGPNKYSVLRKVKINDKPISLVRLIPLGGSILEWFNRILIIPIFNFLGKYIANFGIIILLLTIIIKILLFPLTHKTYTSSAKMRILKPELDKILAKIPQEKAMERQQATMDLYKKAGVNPLGGCLPTLLQFPILFALYRFFPASIELRQQSFLWVKDLSTYDAIAQWQGNIPIVNWIFGNHISLFTLLMAASMLINTWITNKNQVTTNDQQAKTMKIMMYLMPLMMIIWFNGYSAALSYYFFLSTLIGTIQIFISQKLVNEQKVLAQLRANINNNKEVKKSKFQQRLEEMQKQQNKNRK